MKTAKDYCSICYDLISDLHKESECQEYKAIQHSRILNLFDTQSAINGVDPNLIKYHNAGVDDQGNIMQSWYIPNWLYSLYVACKNEDVDFTTKVIKDYQTECENIVKNSRIVDN